MSYENKIMQLKNKLGVKKTKQEERPKFVLPEKPQYFHAWRDSGLEAVENEFGVLFKRQVEYPFSYKHGIYELGQLFNAIEKWDASSIDHPFSLTKDENILFFDTETTGLKGIGTQIFLLGLLEVCEDSFLLTQYVLADPSNEAAFLFETKFWQKEYSIISYNGKTFDWPQLEARWTLNQRILPKLKRHRQIDLLHSSRRIWKNNLEKMKLTNVEEEKLGFKRKGDIPGFLAPIIYADAVKSGNADTLLKVLYHNEWDLLSLITLYIHSTKLLLENTYEETASTLTNVGKWYNDLKFQKESETILRNVADQFSEEEASLANYYLAFDFKKNGAFKEAVNSFEKCLPFLDIRKQIKAYEQLAMIYEHQFKEYDKAIEFTLRGIQVIEKSNLHSENQKIKLLSDWERDIIAWKIKIEFPNCKYSISQASAQFDNVIYRFHVNLTIFLKY